MQGASRESLAAAQERLETLLAAGGTDRTQLGDDLFAVTGLLDGSASLRRALTDPSRGGDTKAGLVQLLLDGKVSADAVDLVAGLVRSRWSQGRDLTDTLEVLAVSSVVAAADSAGRLDQVEDELFRTGRIIEGDARLLSTLSDRTVAGDRKATLVERLLSGKVAPETLRLVRQAVLAPRGLHPSQVLESYVELAAKRREQLVAEVTAALPLETTQRDRLAAALQGIYGRPVRLNVDVDPEVLGGIRVRVGDEVVDGSVLHRLEEARRRLAG